MVQAAAHRPDAASEEGAAAHRSLALSKHEAAGNDFLVLVDTEATWEPSAAFVRSVCDRRRGVGADGLLVVRPGDAVADLAMLLFNADGSRAEMSGNGIRCLAQAAVMAGLVAPGTLRIRTDAGVRRVEYATEGVAASASVDMGEVDLGDELASPLPGARARRASVGNPHLVVVIGAGDGAGREGAVAPTNLSGADPASIGADGVDFAGIDLAAVARDVTAKLGEPVNVEVVRPTGSDTLELRVFERGVGETAACGTGSCAAAAVARSFGLVGDVVSVENPGGLLTVRLGAVPGEPVFLSGPVRHVADVVLPPAALGADIPA